MNKIYNNKGLSLENRLVYRGFDFGGVDGVPIDVPKSKGSSSSLSPDKAKDLGQKQVDQAAKLLKMMTKDSKDHFIQEPFSPDLDRQIKDALKPDVKKTVDHSGFGAKLSAELDRVLSDKKKDPEYKPTNAKDAAEFLVSKSDWRQDQITAWTREAHEIYDKMSGDPNKLADQIKFTMRYNQEFLEGMVGTADAANIYARIQAKFNKVDGDYGQLTYAHVVGKKLLGMQQNLDKGQKGMLNIHNFEKPQRVLILNQMIDQGLL